MSEGIMTINCEGIIDLVNPAAEQILGKSRDEILGKQYAKVFLNDKANDIFNQIILDAIYDPQTRHSKIVGRTGIGSGSCTWSPPCSVMRAGKSVSSLCSVMSRS